jgi:hypothetical protein
MSGEGLGAGNSLEKIANTLLSARRDEVRSIQQAAVLMNFLDVRLSFALCSHYRWTEARA